ncbi:methyl-accepting chemotaxis protein [Salinispira pacifica]|uniref:Methyl-accepting chemotaxis protein n=1 Tax=Salinispira pacifica TaxID=1307761 RepID=V5WGJ3_9SPIO|nr:HAMP domain-containing methyl-accepting chemotaxis protein [Salinispira pacifica]AHC14952.1 hypothetical protein L21SP2_1563 [Salinispira pacifica]
MNTNQTANVKSIPLRIVRNTATVFLIALTVLSVTDYLLEQAITGNEAFQGLLAYFSEFMLLNVLPILIIFSAILYFYSRPIQRAYVQLREQGRAEPEILARAKNRMFRLSSVVLVLNFVSFFGGTIIFFSTQGYFSDPGSPRLWFHLIFTLSSSGVYAFVQSSMNRQVLTPARKLMRIHRMEEDTQSREMNLERKTVLIASLLALYALTYFLPKLFFAYEAELNYAQQLYSIVNEDADMQEAQSAFDDRYEEFSNPPAFRMNERDFQAHLQGVRQIFFISFLAIMAIVIAVALTYSKELVLQLKIQKQKIQGILSGENSLSERISITTNDEVGELSELINRFMDTLESMLQSIAESSKSISGSSRWVNESISQAGTAMHQIVSSVEQISGNADEQSGSVQAARDKIREIQHSIERIGRDIENQSAFVEQTAGAMNEMAGNIASVSKNTQDANGLAATLMERARSGELQIDQSIQTMSAIEDATSQVNDIVKLIADVAAQTNLLAMNAAIEAAHAGESGRGFAVVAEEIRKLAENSSQRTREIEDQIKLMSERVKGGAEDTRKAGDAFRSIFQGIQETSRLIQQVSSAMLEQKSGTDEILSSVGSVVEATNSVKELTGSLQNQSVHIDGSMVELVDISTHIREATSEQSRSNGEVSNMIGRLKDSSEANMEVVGSLETILKRFNLNGDGNGNDHI